MAFWNEYAGLPRTSHMRAMVRRQTCSELGVRSFFLQLQKSRAAMTSRACIVRGRFCPRSISPFSIPDSPCEIVLLVVGVLPPPPQHTTHTPRRPPVVLYNSKPDTQYGVQFLFVASRFLHPAAAAAAASRGFPQQPTRTPCWS